MGSELYSVDKDGNKVDAGWHAEFLDNPEANAAADELAKHDSGGEWDEEKINDLLKK
jgi:hypothetical protein